MHVVCSYVYVWDSCKTPRVGPSRFQEGEPCIAMHSIREERQPRAFNIFFPTRFSLFSLHSIGSAKKPCDHLQLLMTETDEK